MPRGAVTEGEDKGTSQQEGRVEICGCGRVCTHSGLSSLKDSRMLSDCDRDHGTMNATGGSRAWGGADSAPFKLRKNLNVGAIGSQEARYSP